MSRYSVATYAQNLSIFLLNLAMMLAEEGGLRGSTRCEVEHVERENHVLFTLIAAQGDVPFTNRRKGKVGGGIANLCGHILTFLFRFCRLVPLAGHLGDYTLDLSVVRPGNNLT